MQADLQISKPPLLQRLSYWLIVTLISFVFMASGIMKFTGAEEITENFTKWGLLNWKEVIGAVEVIAVLLFLIPKTNTIGLLLITCTMLGAAYIHFSHEEPFFFNLAIILAGWINHLIIKPKK